MFYNAENYNIKIGNTDMDYISFGTGKKKLILIPGLGDALKTVKGTAIPFSIMYRALAKDYKVYVFSRQNDLKSGSTIRDMASDLAYVVKEIGIGSADIIGISQGGMIAQCLAIDNPELVKKMVLVVTSCRSNETIKTVVGKWVELAKVDDYKSIFIDTMENTYTEKRLKKYRLFYSILSRISKPKSLDRFIIQANACLNFDAYDDVVRINCPTFVIGGDNDKIVGRNSSQELAERIIGSRLKLYNGLGHGTYDEASDFNRIVLDFLNE